MKGNKKQKANAGVAGKLDKASSSHSSKHSHGDTDLSYKARKSKKDRILGRKSKSAGQSTAQKSQSASGW